MQSFYAVVKPLGEARPAWKVLRALANILNLPGFNFESAQEVLTHIDLQSESEAPTHVPSNRLSNTSVATPTTETKVGEPCVADIYQLDSIVRRATSLQLTADGRAGSKLHPKPEVVA